MKKLLVATLSFAILTTSVFAQSGEQTVAEKRQEQRHLGIRPGESVEYCGTHWKMQEMFEKHPSMRIMYEKQQKALEREYQEFKKNQDSNPQAKAGTVYTIPVVFHVMHQDGVENISFEQIEDAVEILNRDFRLLNADASSVHVNFAGMPSDAEIEFALATKAPNGDCFRGVTRTNTYLTFVGDDGGDQIQAIRNGNDVYQGNWPGDEYLNIYVAVDIGGAAGYTTNPGWSGTGMSNGIWVQHTYVGSIGTSVVGRSRTLTHEVGHWLNLSHLWGPNNNPGNASSCSDDDGVDDTPECIGVTSCNTSSNTCSGDNAYWGFNQLDNVENYMEYSYCSKMFTQGQVDRMRSAITSSAGGRNNIWTTSNLTAVGVISPADGLCKADFAADNYEVCVGDSVRFSDMSFNNVTGWTWTFSGASPASSTLQNPGVVYTNAGTYAVTLEVTDGSSTTSTTKSAYINVLPATGRVAPFSEGFETMFTLPDPEWFVVNQEESSQEWELTGSTGAGGSSRCIMLDNSSPNSGSDDSFISSTINLSFATSVTLDFKYAFAKRTSSNADKLEVWASSDCGNSWALRKNITAASISTAPDQGGTFVPSSSQWATVSVTNINSTFWTSDFRFKIVYVGGGGNNLYVDDINLNAVVSVPDEEIIRDMQLFPNPTSDDLNLQFTLLNSETASAEFYNSVGQLVKTVPIGSLPEGKNTIQLDVSGQSAGMYLVKLNVGTASLTRTLIIE